VIMKPAPGDEKKPKLLIMDRTPLSVLSNLDGALDWVDLRRLQDQGGGNRLGHARADARRRPRPGSCR
jgi:hypothetical protein